TYSALAFSSVPVMLPIETLQLSLFIFLPYAYASLQNEYEGTKGQGRAEISCKFVSFVAFSGNPLKLYNTIDEEWRQKRKKRRRERRSKLTV
ncbi:MAG: hypothetical protein M3264_12565, partial [Thermoproteota archaeon]|nr:hypothetical protein [Thermoproteota archaeon]